MESIGEYVKMTVAVVKKEDPNRNPFMRFPAEVWEIILDEAEDAETVFHLLSGYPQLSEMFEKKKALWYFKGVLPLIMGKGLFSFKDLRECRLVCKRWEKDVENYLENHPLVQPFNPDLGHGPEFCLQKDTFMFSNGFNGEGNDEDTREWNFFDYLHGFEGLTAEKAVSFMDEIKHLESHKQDAQMQHSLKVLSLMKGATSIYTDTPHELSDEEVKLMWETVLRAAEVFGKYLWCFKFIGDNSVANSLEFVKLLPNLRILVLSGSGFDLLKVSGKETMPRLEKLETLCFEGMKCGPGTRNLLDTHRPQLRRLHLFTTCLGRMLNYTKNWRNLTELSIRKGLWDEGQHENCRKFLELVDAPQLVRLEVAGIGRSSFPVELSVATDIGAWLKRFPRLLSLTVKQWDGNLQINEEPLLKNPGDKSTFPLVFLRIHESFHLTYDFLRWFPSLQHLHLDVNRYPMVIDWSGPVSPGGIRLKREIQCGRLYESNLWEVLRKLGMICVSNRFSKFYREFDRGTYELLKAGGFLHGDGTRVRDDPIDYYYYPLRPDIVAELERNATAENESLDDDSPDENESDSEESLNSDREEGSEEEMG